MMCKTGVSRLISALAIGAFAAAASAQSPSGSLGELLVPSNTGTASFELQPLAKTWQLGHSRGGIWIVERDASPIGSGFSTVRGQQFLLDADLTPRSAGLSVAWPTTASDWGRRIERAGTYRISSPNTVDKPWYEDDERLITTIAVAVFLLILLK